MDRQKILSALPYLTFRPGSDGIQAFNCPAEKLLETLSFLKSDFAFESLNDIASLDMGLDADLRFGAVYHLFSHTRKIYLRLVAMCEDNLQPSLESAVGVYASADWLEREVFDLMGIKFINHPDLRRILMWDSYTHHPLRKDFPLAGLDAPLPDSFEDNEDAATVCKTPMEGGPFVSAQGDAFAADREPRSKE